MLLTEEAVSQAIARMSAVTGAAAGVLHAEEYVYTSPFVVKHLSKRDLGPYRGMLLPPGWTLGQYEGLFRRNSGEH